jgi:hypothetical protein
VHRFYYIITRYSKTLLSLILARSILFNKLLVGNKSSLTNGTNSKSNNYNIRPVRIRTKNMGQLIGRWETPIERKIIISLSHGLHRITTKLQKQLYLIPMSSIP